MSIEKLIGCGCLAERGVHASRDDNGISIYGGIQRRVSLTVTGLKFHVAVTGDEPGWLRKDDENRDDIHPVNPLPRDQRKGVSSIPEQDRFVRLVSEFDAIHYRLLDESKGDSRTVRDTIRSIDGAPEAAIVVEGRNPHPVLPGERAWRELYENGLVNLANPETIMSEHAYKLGCLTPLGARFLQFIEDRETAPDFVRPAMDDLSAHGRFAAAAAILVAVAKGVRQPARPPGVGAMEGWQNDGRPRNDLTRPGAGGRCDLAGDCGG